MQTQTIHTESDLIALLKQADRSVYNYLYKQYAASLLGVIYKITGDIHTSEDVLQEAFIKIWSKIDQYDPCKGRLYTWMINIARNAAKDALRSKGEIMKQKITGDAAVIEDQHAKAQHTDAIGIKALVCKLRPECRMVIELIYFRGYRIIDIAEALVIPEGTVKTRMREGIKSLRKNFEESYVLV
jgi:RNA polymerase sigma-70 factor (ECF subfamily)